MSLSDVAALYLRFAVEAVGESACFTAWAASVAEDEEVLEWIASLPESKQQPNLVFAAARWVGAVAPRPYEGLREVLLTRGEAVRSTVLTQSTQTNEPRRLATLMPVFVEIAKQSAGPLALVEVGASAGLCLYPDGYSYEWSRAGVLITPGTPILRCEVRGAMPVPDGVPEIAWRGGSDLNPLDVTDDSSLRWLQTLVWPEQAGRRELLAAAARIASQDPPHLRRGDLVSTLGEVVSEASGHGTVVVFHSAVIAYLDDESRRAFADRLRQLVADGVVRWVSNEGDKVLPEITRTARQPGRESERFVMGPDGRAVARTHGHGASLTWIE